MAEARLWIKKDKDGFCKLRDIFNTQKARLLLNPNCSELIGALKINTDQEFKAVIDELSRITDVGLYLNVGLRTAEQSACLEVKKDADGITRLVLEPLDWADKNERAEIDCKIPVPASYVFLENGKLDVNPQTVDTVFSEIKVKVSKVDWNMLFVLESSDFAIEQPDKKQKEEVYLIFKNARLDPEPLRRHPKAWSTYYFSVETEELEFKYNSKEQFSNIGYSSFEGSLFTMIFDTDWELFPGLRKIIRLFKGRFENRITSHDGGTTKRWEQWCNENFAEYFINKMGDSPTHEKGTFYLLPINNLADFKDFIKDLYSLGKKVAEVGDKVKVIKPGNLKKLEIINSEPYVFYRWGKVHLEMIRILPEHLDLKKNRKEISKQLGHEDSIKIGFYPREDETVSSIDQLTFYIFLSKYSNAFMEEDAEKFEEYLKKRSKIVRT